MILLLDLDFLLATPQFFSACCSAVQAVLFAYELPLLWMDFELIPKFLRSYSEVSPKLFRSYSEVSPKFYCHTVVHYSSWSFGKDSHEMNWAFR